MLYLFICLSGHGVVIEVKGPRCTFNNGGGGGGGDNMAVEIGLKT